ncbi:MAG: hypothetical protein ACI875_002482, partial [Planctomycetota bacterium]
MVHPADIDAHKFAISLRRAPLLNESWQRAKRSDLHSVCKTFRTQTQVKAVAGLTLRVDRHPRISRSDPIVKEALDMVAAITANYAIHYA